MWKYVLKKLLLAVPVLLGITVIDYIIMSLAGSPLDMMTGPRITEGAVAARAAQWGLDQPVIVQYFNWLRELLHGNLGFAYKSGQPVADIIRSHMGPTLLLMGVSMVLGLVLAVPAGIYSAVHRYRKRDYAVVSASFLFSSIPGFFLSLIFVYIFTVRLGWLPSSGMYTPGVGGGAGDVIRHLIMPALVLAVGVAGGNIRYIRSAVLEILEMDYLRTARAKGLGRRIVIRKHALRNALLPIITVIGMQVPTLFGGAVIVEQLFSWPGLGQVTWDAVLSRNYPVIMGVCLLSAVVVLLSNLVTDLLYALVDPTIKY